jgi:chemotaxis signal transduction protein
MHTDVIPIRLGANWILVRAALVSEFLPATPWLSVPGSSSLVPGVMTWRGRAIAVVDLPRALNFVGIGALDERSRIMVVEHAVGAIAIPVDGAREVRTLNDSQIRPQHVSSVPYSTFEVDDAEAVLPLVELEALLAEIGKVNA